jgi:hypothetical protein
VTPDLEPARGRQLADLPPAVADRVRFDVAAPRRLRGDHLPAEAREVFAQLWDGIVADIYDEVAGVRRTKLFSRTMVDRILARVAVRFRQAERALVVTAVYWPLGTTSDRGHVVAGGVGGATSAAAEEVAAYSSAGTGAAVAITSAIVGELFETYVAASGRTRQYQRAGRSPAPDLVVADLAEAMGLGEVAGRRASAGLSRRALAWLDGQLVRRAGRRFSRGLLPVAGVAIGAGAGGVGVRKVLKVPLRPASEDEVIRMARDIVDDPAQRDVAYAADLARFAGYEALPPLPTPASLAAPPPPPVPPPPPPPPPP